MSEYTYFGVVFTSTGACDEHIRKVLDNGRKEVNRLHSVISNTQPALREEREDSSEQISALAKYRNLNRSTETANSDGGIYRIYGRQLRDGLSFGGMAILA